MSVSPTESPTVSPTGSPSESPTGSRRCVAHPSRPAVDACQVCHRPRCDADRAGWAPGCAVCRSTARADRRVSRGTQRELLVRAALAANFSSVAMGYVVAQYVQADVFEYLAPVVLGLLCGFAASSAAGNPRAGVLANRVRLVCAVYALLGTAYGFVLEGTFSVFSTSTDVLVPYALAVGAAWVWTTPPRSKKVDKTRAGDTGGSVRRARSGG